MFADRHSALFLAYFQILPTERCEHKMIDGCKYTTVIIYSHIQCKVCVCVGAYLTYYMHFIHTPLPLLQTITLKLNNKNTQFGFIGLLSALFRVRCACLQNRSQTAFITSRRRLHMTSHTTVLPRCST